MPRINIVTARGNGLSDFFKCNLFTLMIWICAVGFETVQF